MARYKLLMIVVLMALLIVPMFVGATTDEVGCGGLSNTGVAGYLLYATVTASSSGTLQSVGVNVGTAGNGDVVTAIYDSSGAFIAQSVSTPTTSGWDDLSISGSIPIVMGDQYILASQFDSNSDGAAYGGLSCPIYQGAISGNPYNTFPSITPPSGVSGASQYLRMIYAAYSSPTTPFLQESNTAIDQGQSITFTSNIVSGQGTQPFTVNYMVYEQGIPIANMLFTSCSLTTNSWTWTPQPNLYSGNSLFSANVAWTDTHPITVNSIANTFGYNGALSVSISPSTPSILLGSSQTFIETTTPGTGPYTINWIMTNSMGFFANGLYVASAFTTNAFSNTPLATGTYNVNVVVTDFATTNVVVASSNSVLTVSLLSPCPGPDTSGYVTVYSTTGYNCAGIGTALTVSEPYPILFMVNSTPRNTVTVNMIAIQSASTQTVGGFTSSGSGINNFIYLMQVSATSSGPLQTIGANIQTPAGSITTAIYADNSGVPGALLANSLSTSATGGWMDLSMRQAVSISAGTTYWIGLTVSSGSISVYVDSSCKSKLNEVGGYPNLPNPFVVSATSSSCFNVRMSYGPPTQYNIPIASGTANAVYVIPPNNAFPATTYVFNVIASNGVYNTVNVILNNNIPYNAIAYPYTCNVLGAFQPSCISSYKTTALIGQYNYTNTPITYYPILVNISQAIPASSFSLDGTPSITVNQVVISTNTAPLPLNFQFNYVFYGGAGNYIVNYSAMPITLNAFQITNTIANIITQQIYTINSFTEPQYTPINAITILSSIASLNGYTIPISYTSSFATNSITLYIPSSTYKNPVFQLLNQTTQTSSSGFAPRINNWYNFVQNSMSSTPYQTFNVYLPSSVNTSLYQLNVYQCVGFASNIYIQTLNGGSALVQQVMVGKSATGVSVPLLNGINYGFKILSATGALLYTEATQVFNPSTPIPVYIPCTNNTVPTINPPNIAISCNSTIIGLNAIGNCQGSDTSNDVSQWTVLWLNYTNALGLPVLVNSIVLYGNSFATNIILPANNLNYYAKVVATIDFHKDPITGNYVYGYSLSSYPPPNNNPQQNYLVALVIFFIPLVFAYYHRTALLILTGIMLWFAAGVGIYTFDLAILGTFTLFLALVIVIDERTS